MADNIQAKLSTMPYNDQYNFDDQFSDILFRPNSIVSQRDLNEEQSEWDDQFKLFGNHVFRDGTIMSGMHLVVAGHKDSGNNGNNNQTTNTPNLLNLSNVSAVNSVINTDDWFTSGEIDVSPESERAEDYPGVEVDLPSAPQGAITVSFGVQKTAGNLKRIGFGWSGNLQQVQFSIDGINANNNSFTAYTSGQQLPDINDGQYHTVSSTFQVANSSDVQLYIVANNGLDVSQADNTARYVLSSIMINKGHTAQPWTYSNTSSILPIKGARNTIMNVSPGVIWLDGKMRRFSGGNIDITGQGKELIGVHLTHDIVTAQEDNRLYDTTNGAVSQWERMSDRLHYNVSLAYDDPKAISIFTLQDGKIVNGNGSTGNSHLDDLLAARTYDQSGSFRVSGFDFDTTPDEQNNHFMANLNIDAGIAYVMGYAVYKLQPTTLHIPISNKEETQSHEPLEFRPSGEQSDPYTHQIMELTSEPLGAQPVDKDSVHVYGPLEVVGSREDGIRSNQMSFDSNGIDGQDELPLVFQAQNHAGGGPLGNFCVHFGVSGNKTDTNYQYIFEYNFKKQATYVYVDVDASYSPEDVVDGISPTGSNTWDKHGIDPTQYDDKYDPKASYIELDGMDGIFPEESNGIWYLEWGNDALNLMNTLIGETGRTYFIDGVTNYAYQGPDDVSGSTLPDYHVVSGTDPISAPTGSSQGIRVQQSSRAVQGAEIQFGGPNNSGITPPSPYKTDIENNVWVDYKYYDAAVGILTLDQDGNFNVVMGKPAALGVARPPEQISPKVLRLGYIILTPDSWKSDCEFSSVTRIPFSGLQDLVTRISNLESIVQNGLLDTRAKANIDPTGIQNILCDDFTTMTTADPSFEEPYDYEVDNSNINSEVSSMQSSADLSCAALSASASISASYIAQSQLASIANSVSDKYGDSGSVASEIRSSADSSCESYASYVTSSASASASSISASASSSIAETQLSLENETDYYGFNVAYDLGKGIISTNDDPSTIRAIRPTISHDDQCHVFDHTITASFNHEVPQEGQDKMNSTININNDSRNTSNNGQLDIYPNADDFINCNTYEFQDGRHLNNIQLHDWFTYNNSLFQDSNPNTHLQDSYSQGQNFLTKARNNWSLKKSTGLQTANAGTEYTEPRKIEFSTVWLTPNTQNYYILLNDMIPVSANQSSDPDSHAGSPVSLHYNGTDTQVSTINADGNGQATGWFQIPNNLTTGIIKVALVNSTVIGQPSQSEVSNTYYANGIRNDDVATVAHRYNATDQYDEVSNPPIAQTVRVRKDSVLTSLKLYFAEKPAGNPGPGSNLLVQLRQLDENGYPSNVIEAQTTINPNDVQVGNIPTTIEFDDPVYAHAGDTFAITLLTNSGEYVIGTDNQNPYPQGKLITSDGKTWTVQPNTALKFELNRASFNTNTTLTFNADNITKTISKVALLADYVTPDNTSLKWSLSINGNEPLPINRRRQIEYITDAMTGSNAVTHDANGNPTYNTVKKLQLFCDLNESPNSTTNDEIIPGNSRVSPIISMDTVALAVSASINSTNIKGHSNHLSLNTNYGSSTPVTNIYQAMQNADGLYMTRDIRLYGRGYNTITTTFDAHMDDHCKVVPIYSFSNGDTWGEEPNQVNGKESTNPGWLYYSDWNKDPNTGKPAKQVYTHYPKVIPIDPEFNRYTFKVQVPGTNIGRGDSESNFPKVFQMGLLLYSDSPYHQPMVKRLTNILTIETPSTSNDDDRPFTNDDDMANYIDVKNDSNNPSSPFDWNSSNDFSGDYNANS